MSNGHRWSKFWWADWQKDYELRLCSLGAQGLWMRLLCIAHEGTPIGHVTINGKPPSVADLAVIAGRTSIKEVTKLLAELEANGVFSRTDKGVIFCRRMSKGAAASEAGREYVARRWKSNGTADHPNTPPNRGAKQSDLLGGLTENSIGPLLQEAEAEERRKNPPYAPPRGGLSAEIVDLAALGRKERRKSAKAEREDRLREMRDAVAKAAEARLRTLKTECAS